MGAYLSKPVTKKYSSDESNDYIDVGASSMQGWRIRQEDAHNYILDFDKNISFFAVYDGHGGAEVATYCSEKLPEFLKNLETYKEKNFEQALRDAFLGFDATLIEEDVIDTLKKLAGKKNEGDSELAEEEEEEEEDLVELCQEGSLPLDQVLEKYKGCVEKFPFISKLKEDEPRPSSSGTSKPLSPFLRGRRNPTRGCTDERASNSEDSSLPSSSNLLGETKTTAESECAVSSSETSDNKKNTEKDEETNSNNDENISSEKLTKCTSPDSSSITETPTKPPECKMQNGDIDTHQGEEENKEHAGKKVSSPVTNSEVHSQQGNGEMPTASPSKQSATKVESTNDNSKISSSTIDGTCPKSIENSTSDDGSSSSEDDADFHAEENSSTEDGDEEPGDDETEDENDDEECDLFREYDPVEMGDDPFGMNMDMIDEPGKNSGCTAVVALLHGRHLYVANAGDSRCVVCRDGKAVEMSLDHKPDDDEESARILQAGGKVTLDGRVNGGLNLSRAIGDHSYKINKDLPPEKQMITALPDVKQLIISPEDEFMILACDGIWNYLSSTEVVDYVKKKINEGQEKMSQICEELFDICLAPNTIGDGTGCDNMTAVIVRFKPKILELPTTISAEAEAEATALGASKRRCTSPTRNNDKETNENSSKRFKTDDECSNECDSGSNITEESTNQTIVKNSS